MNCELATKSWMRLLTLGALLVPGVSAARSSSAKAAMHRSAAQSRKPTVAGKPLAPAAMESVRDRGELWAVWRAVEIVERSPTGQSLAEEAEVRTLNGRQPETRVNSEFKNNISPSLKNFIRFGESSLTPYEATKLQEGLGIGGTPQMTAREAKSPYTRGDRLQISIRYPNGTRVMTRGIKLGDTGILAVDRNNRYHVFAPEYDNGKTVSTGGGKEKRIRVKIEGVLSKALDDGKLG